MRISPLPRQRPAPLACGGSTTKGAHNPPQIFQACGNTFRRGDLRGPELDILFNDGPAGIAVFHERRKESREIDVASPDYGEYFVFDGFFEGPLVPARFLEDLYIAILDVHEPQFALVFFRFLDGVAMAINAVAGVQAQTDVGVGRRVEEPLTLLGCLYISRDMGMKYQVQTKLGRDPFRIRHDVADMFPLFSAQYRTAFVVDTPGEGIALRRLIVCHHQEGSFQCRQQVTDFPDPFDDGFSGGRILRMVLGESVLLALLGGLPGLAVAFVLITRVRDSLMSFVPTLSLAPDIALAAIGLMIAFGLITGLIPALNAMRLNIVTALGRS